MRGALRLAVVFVLGFGLAGCGSNEGDPVMPDVLGQRLDVALSDIVRAGFTEEVEILGGGVFGVVDKSNWVVCGQLPAADEAVTTAPRLTVDRSCGDDAPEQTESPTEVEGGATPTPSETPMETDWNGNQIQFKFGQAAPFTSTAGSLPNTPLTFTVSAPTAFTPADPSDATQAATVYFTVTIKNESDAETWDPDFVFSKAISGDTDGDEIHDGEINGTYDLNGVEIPPGQSVTFKDGWSVVSADDVRYELDIDGLAGYTIYFTK